MQNLHARVHEGVLTISAPYGTGRAAPADMRIDVQPSICACHPDAAACWARGRRGRSYPQL